MVREASAVPLPHHRAPAPLGTPSANSTPCGHLRDAPDCDEMHQHDHGSIRSDWQGEFTEIAIGGSTRFAAGIQSITETAGPCRTC